MSNFYDVLGVSKSATKKEIKTAYRSLALKWHPDKNSSKVAEEKFKEVNKAYETLSNKEKKTQYDRGANSPFGGYGNRPQRDAYSSSYEGRSTDDILNDLFGNNGFGSSRYTNTNMDLKQSVKIPLYTAINGGTVDVKVGVSLITLKIPKGSTPGTKFRLVGKGLHNHGKTGDLYVSLDVQPSDNYEINGNNLTKVHPISLKTAIFGGTSTLNFFGESVTIKIPENTKFNQRIRLSKGFKGGVTYITLDIRLPKASEVPSLKHML